MLQGYSVPLRPIAAVAASAIVGTEELIDGDFPASPPLKRRGDAK